MTVKKGNNIVVEYEGKLESGEVFDSSQHGDHSHPLEFEVGSGNVIKGFDQGVLGMKIGEERTIEIEPEEAYGKVREDLYQEIPKEIVNLDEEPEEGMTLMLATPDGRQFPAKVIEFSDENITVDLNHPLAGEKLIFKIKLVKIK